VSEPVYPIASFPIDGHLWWLRWFDHPAYDGVTSTYTVAVALSRLPAVARSDDLPALDAGLVAAAGPQITRRVQTGLIPVLAIGTVYRNGCPVGLLWANPEPFTFERSRCAVEVLAIREPASDDLLPLWAGDRPGLALGRAAYALRGFDDSLCLRISALDGSGRQLVLPCPEVFRSLLAPHRTIALALTNGPWEHTRKQVVHDEGTHVRRGGAWRVALAGGVGPAHAVTISNLILNPVGRRVANEVWAAIITPSKLPRDRERDDARPRPARFGRLRARLPFDWDVLDVTVCGVRPSTVADAWIGLRIVSLTWPPPPKGPPRDVWWVPWKDTRPGVTRVPVDEPRPYGGVREPSGCDGLLRSREPITHQVCLGRDLAGVGSKQPFAAGVAQHSPQSFATEKRWVAHLGVRRRPGRGRAVLGQHGVAALDGVQLAKHRVGRGREAVPTRPLDMPDPHRHPRQLGRVRIQLDPQHRLRPHLRELALQAQCLRFHHDPVLQILERQQGQVKEVAGPAGRVQHAVSPQPV